MSAGNVTALGLLQNVQQFAVLQIVDPPSILDAADATLSVALDSVGIGDSIVAVMPYDGQGMIIGVVASGEGTADVSFHNASGGTVDLASGLWKFLITRT